MDMLDVKGLSKAYPSFCLKDITFSLRAGVITGFIGRNGAGKTTALKALLGMVHPDAGEVCFFGLDFAAHQQEIKRRIGYVAGGFGFYSNKRLSAITAAARAFYPGYWDDAAYCRYLQRFRLDEGKTPAQLSEGMKVKYALTLALSHRAELLILDEPTSGIDPVSREELKDIFLALNREGATILFSTHITSDLEDCADRVLYLRDGALLADAPLRDFEGGYRAVSLTAEQRGRLDTSQLIGLRQGKEGYAALLKTEDAAAFSLPAVPASLETIMIHLEKEGEV